MCVTVAVQMPLIEENTEECLENRAYEPSFLMAPICFAFRQVNFFPFCA